MNSEQLKAVALFGVSMLIAAVVTAIWIPSANQYEVSLYDAFPSFFWILVVGAMLSGVLVLFGSAHTSNDQSWVFGIALLLLTNILIFLLPTIRGYYMYGDSDPMSHLGYIQDLLTQGGIGSNIYPPFHLLTLILADATGIELMATALLVPVVFSVVYFGGLYYLLVYVFDDPEKILFGLPLAMVPVLGQTHVLFRPYDASMLLLPVLFYLFFKSQRETVPSVRATFVLVLVSLILYHPLTALFLIPIFAFYFLLRHVPWVQTQYATPTSFVSLSAAIFLLWYSNYRGILFRFRSTYNTIFGTQEGDAAIRGYTQTVDKASPELIDLLRVGIFKYGVELLLFGLGFALLVVLLLNTIGNTQILDSYTAMFLGILIMFTIGGVLFLVFPLQGTHDRAWAIAKIASVVLVGQLFYLLWHNGTSTDRYAALRTTVLVPFVAVVLFVVVLSVFTIYPSPIGSSTNQHVTEMEVSGTDWYMGHSDSDGDAGLVDVGISYHRFYHAKNGIETANVQSNSMPVHFNYTVNEYLGQSFDTTNHVMINSEIRLLYPELFPKYPENWRYTPAEFERLETDKTVDRIYDNGDYNQYWVTPLSTHGGTASVRGR